MAALDLRFKARMTKNLEKQGHSYPVDMWDPNYNLNLTENYNKMLDGICGRVKLRFTDPEEAIIY